jgi:hypothetical protein
VVLRGHVMPRLLNVTIKASDRSLMNAMGRLATLLAISALISSLLSGCGCLAADSGDKPACQKYQTNWDLDRIYHEE